VVGQIVASGFHKKTPSAWGVFGAEVIRKFAIYLESSRSMSSKKSEGEPAASPNLS
jgi:hypothetical protein